MKKEDTQKRINALTIQIFKLVKSFPKDQASDVIIKQILRSSSSVRINYRSLTSSKSNKDFTYKLQVISEEADETFGWLELIEELNLIDFQRLKPVIQESREIMLILSKSAATAKRNLKNDN